MALNFGELLGGIGAAIGGTAPQYVQDLKSRKQAELVDREKAMYQDAAIGLQLLESGQLQQLDALGRDRMDQLRKFPDAVPNDTLRMLALNKLAMGGDRAALGQLHAELISANKAGQVKGYLSAPAAPEGYTLSQGQTRFEGGRNVASVPAATPEAKATFDIISAERAKEMGLPEGKQYQINTLTGQISAIGGGDTNISVGNATDSERTTGILANRLDFAQSQINEVLANSPQSNKPKMGATALNALGLNYLANISNPAERQIIEAAQLDMLDAALTIGTGAAYTREQLEGYRIAYFPQVGDTDEAIAAKSARLNNYIQAAYVKAGRAAPPEMRSSNTYTNSNLVPLAFVNDITQAEWDSMTAEQRKEFKE
jgi:hypothetical protein